MSNVKRTEHIAQLRKQAAFHRAQAGFSYQRIYALEDENKALREEVERGNRITVAMALDISAVGEALGIPGEEQEGGTGEFIDLIRELQKEVAALRAKLAMAEDAAAKGDAARQQCGGMEMEIEELRAEAKALRDERDSQQRVAIKAMEELAALRARVAVVPDGYALVPVEPTREMFIAINKEDDKAYAGGCHHGAQFEWLWAAAIEAAPRPNGLTVSESALDTLRKAASGEVKHLNNGLCPDDIEGHEARDPDCPVCRALIETGKESDNV
ncbi:hypothetical protein O0072_11765 [Pseudomonas aeruginosa]|uniref:hypothetical protein n=1 Tax=Pseudomonas aeruginosa TaxID=287 RepID=UPI0023581302|nr:hypothetical protein KKY72_13085 [Pseudomonas aeruginosa]